MSSDLPAPDLALDLDLVAIRERADAATPGPWFVVGPPSYPSTPYVTAGSPDPRHGRFIADLDYIADATDEGARFGSNQANDAKFIAHARTDVDRLLAEVHRLRTVADGLRAHIEAVIALHQPRPADPNSESAEPVLCSCGASEVRLADDGSSIGPVEYPCPTLRALAPLLERRTTT
jgi:hypothetical protein